MATTLASQSRTATSRRSQGQPSRSKATGHGELGVVGVVAGVGEEELVGEGFDGVAHDEGVLADQLAAQSHELGAGGEAESVACELCVRVEGAVGAVGDVGPDELGEGVGLGGVERAAEQFGADHDLAERVGVHAVDGDEGGGGHGVPGAADQDAQELGELHLPLGCSLDRSLRDQRVEHVVHGLDPTNEV